MEEDPGRPKSAAVREDCHQVHLLSLDGGEARRLTNLPRGVESFEWSPDGRPLAVLSISVGDWAVAEFGRKPWDDPEYFRSISPATLAPRVTWPILIQDAERDLRCTVAQAELLFTLLRSHRAPVWLMRVPHESHELTRSGTPFRRAEILVQVRDWCTHVLGRGERKLPPISRNRAVL